ncbi:Uncharacterized protein TCM_022350 [Theobroma cacao]|uniref:KIB1-4 beta-propeller domain-containing protein n=1 Tax=Theobroma cacao TaxID=3641 RepID=A0A061EUD7_THECC|nr:Uncharacterized protein TCM_022350 [Theobroma cacao]
MASMELKDMEPVENKDFPSDLISQRHPLLVISHGKQHQKKTFFSISSDRHYPGIIPEVENKLICTSSFGWLVLREDSHECCVLNLESREKIQLPALDMNSSFCILTASPSDCNCYIVFIHGKDNKIIFKFCRPGDQEFSSQTFEGFPCSLSSVAFFGGKIICSLYPESFLLTAEIVGSTLQFSDLITKEVPPFVSAPKLLSQSHLVEFSGEMLLVYRFRFISGSCWDMGFTVFKLDFSKRALEEVISIGENAIFLDEDHGICCPATD